LVAIAEGIRASFDSSPQPAREIDDAKTIYSDQEDESTEEIAQPND
jgi:hypothetical protein